MTRLAERFVELYERAARPAPATSRRRAGHGILSDPAR